MEKHEYEDLQLAISILRDHFGELDNANAQADIDRLDDRIKAEMVSDTTLKKNDVKSQITLDVDEYLLIDCALRMYAERTTVLSDYGPAVKLMDKLTKDFYDMKNWVD